MKEMRRQERWSSPMWPLGIVGKNWMGYYLANRAARRYADLRPS